ncbi:hypothetical protein JCM19237_222 [Photobacterium aphoticum]|uniref:Uncharacterized protein n=1 Tax=Photobacterium aphoticum TaxID=754436 RepID=A0A090R0Y1_9GAMM|nr:hypothetical protein JCM19237_222 [Photobacterium aphoticum]
MPERLLHVLALRPKQQATAMPAGQAPTTVTTETSAPATHTSVQ